MFEGVLTIGIVVVLGGLAWLVRQRPVGGLSGKALHTPTLLQYAKDLTALATSQKLDPVIGRREEIERVIQILARRTKNNPVLVGKAGVGKTAIVEGLAQAIVAKQVPLGLQSKRVLALDLTSILAGTKYRGEFEQRLKRIADEIVAAKRSIILFVDEVHTLAQAGESTGGIEAADILKPALARGDLQLVGATTFLEYQQYIKPDATLDRRFEPILVDEPTPAETLQILRGIKQQYEQYHHVIITDAALTQAVAQAKKITVKSFPDKAIDLMDEAAARVSLEQVKNATRPATVTAADVTVIAQEWQQDSAAGL